MARLLKKAEMNEKPFDKRFRLTSKLEAVLLLRETFESRAIEPTSTPAQVRSSDGCFQK